MSRVKELEAEVTRLSETLENVRAHLDYYRSRGQNILDKTAEWCLKILEERPTAAELNVIRAFLKDQSVVDLRHGGTPVHELAKARPFPVVRKDDSPDFGIREAAE